MEKNKKSKSFPEPIHSNTQINQFTLSISPFIYIILKSMKGILNYTSQLRVYAQLRNRHLLRVGLNLIFIKFEFCPTFYYKVQACIEFLEL